MGACLYCKALFAFIDATIHHTTPADMNNGDSNTLSYYSTNGTGDRTHGKLQHIAICCHEVSKTFAVSTDTSPF